VHLERHVVALAEPGLGGPDLELLHRAEPGLGNEGVVDEVGRLALAKPVDRRAGLGAMAFARAGVVERDVSLRPERLERAGEGRV
jgi:hypothetical protein